MSDLDLKSKDDLVAFLTAKFDSVTAKFDSVTAKFDSVTDELKSVKDELSNVVTSLNRLERNSIRATPSIFFRDHLIGVSSMLHHPLEKSNVRGPPVEKTLTYCVMSAEKFKDVFKQPPATAVALHLTRPAGVLKTDSIRKVDDSEGTAKVHYAVMLVSAGHCLWKNGEADYPADMKSCRFWCPPQYTREKRGSHDVGFLELPALPSSCKFVVDLSHSDFRSPTSTPAQALASVSTLTTDDGGADSCLSKRSKRGRGDGWPAGTGAEGSKKEDEDDNGPIMLERAQSIFGVSQSFDVVGKAAVYHLDQKLYHFVEHKGGVGIPELYYSTLTRRNGNFLQFMQPMTDI